MPLRLPRCPLNLMRLVMRLLDLVVAIEIVKMVIPLRFPVTLHTAPRNGTHYLEDADSTCAVRVSED